MVISSPSSIGHNARSSQPKDALSNRKEAFGEQLFRIVVRLTARIQDSILLPMIHARDIPSDTRVSNALMRPRKFFSCPQAVRVDDPTNAGHVTTHPFAVVQRVEERSVIDAHDLVHYIVRYDIRVGCSVRFVIEHGHRHQKEGPFSNDKVAGNQTAFREDTMSAASSTGSYGVWARLRDFSGGNRHREAWKLHEGFLDVRPEKTECGLLVVHIMSGPKWKWW